MLELLFIGIVVWLVFKFIGLAVRVSWCLTKVIATILFVVALPLLILIAVAAGGILLLIPILAIAGAIALLKSCL